MLIDQIQPQFDTDTRGRICQQVMRSAVLAVEEQRNRDEDFFTWAAQAEGDPYWAGVKQRWQGSCMTEDPMTDEHIFETSASVCYILRQSDMYSVSETDEGGEQEASDLEAFMNDTASEALLNTTHLYDLVSNACRYSYGVAYVGWKQDYRNQYRPVARHRKTKRIVETGSDEYKAKPDDYRLTEEITQSVEKDGIDIRVAYPGDVYLDPPTAQSFETAARIVERFEYTEDDLLNGIADYGFDEEQVEELLKSGATSSLGRSYNQERNSIEGVASEEHTWEVYMITGTPPALLEDGESTLKDSDRRRDYQWMVCPSKNICFKFAPSGYHRRPYAKFPFRGRPGRMVGHSVCSMLSPLQLESSLAFRFRIDFRDLFMSSPLMVPDTWYGEMQQWKSYPGSKIPYPTGGGFAGPTSIQPLPYNPAGYQAGMQDCNDTRMRANQLFSADARGPAETVQRTATEARQAGAGADEKLDLIVMNFQFGMAEVGNLILSHTQQFGVADGPINKQIGSRAVSISPEMLRKKFRIQVVGSSESSDPQQRLNKAEMLAKVAMTDPILQAKYAQGDQTGMYWILNHVYRALGVKNPAVIDGPPPSAPPNPQYVLEGVMAIAQQYAAQNDPAALAIMQAVQQMMAQGGGQQQGGQGQPQQKISVSANLKDMPPVDQAALLQMIGLPDPRQGQQPNPQMNGNGHGAQPQQAVPMR